MTNGVAAALALIMAVLANDADVNRVYYGTDTRSQALLVGAVLAVAFHARAFTFKEQRWLDRAGLAGLAGCLLLFGLVDSADVWMYRGGFAFTAIAASALIAGAAGPDRGALRSVLSLPPFPELGRISYGVYLWHWPVLVFLSEDRTGLDGAALLVVRLAVTLLVSIASYQLVEQPIRHHRWPVGRAAMTTAVAVAFTALLIVEVVPVRPDPDARLAAARSDADELALLPYEPEAARRVLIVGDSVGLGLALHFPKEEFNPPIVIRSIAKIGCGVAERDTPLCKDPAPEWRDAVQAFAPDTTILMTGVWDARKLTIGGRTYEPRSPAFEAYLLAKLDAELRALTAKGGSVGVLTVPCFAPKRAASAPEPADVAWFNTVLRAAAAAAARSRRANRTLRGRCAPRRSRPNRGSR